MTSFGNNGYVSETFGQDIPPMSGGQGVVVAPNGDIYQAGVAADAKGDDELYVARYDSNGQLDTSFGVGGVTYENVGDGSPADTATPSGGLGSLINSTLITLTPGGEPVVATTANTASGSSDEQVAVLEFTQTGQLNTAFDSTGVAKLALGTDTEPGGLTVDSQGDIVVSGSTGSSMTNGTFFAARLTPSGARDNSFGTNGIVEPAATSGTSTLGSGVVAQSNGDLTFAVADTLGPASEIALMRLTSNGTPDGSFGTGGLVLAQPSTSTSSPDSVALAVAEMPDGGYAVTGAAFSSLNLPQIVVTRFTSDGRLDTSFGTTGSTISSSGNAIASIGTGILVQPDGKLLVTGLSIAGAPEPVAIRLDANGTPDYDFASGNLSYGSGSTLFYGVEAALAGPNLVMSGIAENATATTASSTLQEINLDTAPALVTAVDSTSVQVGTPVHLAAADISPDDEPLGEISWDLGSGNFGDATGNTASKTFTTPGTYTIRAEATDAYGLSTVSTQTVTVTAAATKPATVTPTTTPTTVTPAAVIAPTLKLVRLSVLHGKVKVTLLCAFAACKVNANLTTHVRSAKGKSASLSANGRGKAVTVASTKLSLGVNQKHTFTLKLNKRGASLLKRFGKIPAVASFKLTNTKPAKTIHHNVRVH